MSFYEDRVLPHLIALVMRNKWLAEYRARVVPGAQGRVLEIGIGSGLNLPFYGRQVEEVIGLDPSMPLLRMIGSGRGTPTLLAGSAEAIPLSSASIDTIVTTWTLCSVPEVDLALAEMRRVLRPGGRLLFVEHGRAAGAKMRWLQDRLTPAWRRIAGGCHLNRPMDRLIAGAGFEIEKIDCGYMRFPNPVAYMYEGSARPR